MIGSKNVNVDRSINWQEPFPNFSEPDIVIFNLQTLEPNILENIDKDKLSVARDEVLEKFITGGTIIFITGPKNEKYIQGQKYHRYYLSPLSIQVEQVNAGNKIKYQPEQPFKSYLENVKKFSFYLYDICINKDIRFNKGTTDSIAKILEIIKNPQKSQYRLVLERLQDHSVVDNSGHYLGGAFRLTIPKLNFKSGSIIFLPPPTKKPVEECIDLILEDMNINPKFEDFPAWASKLDFPRLGMVYKEMSSFGKKKLEIETKIEELQKESDKLKSFFGLLYGRGTQLENVVRDTFELMGFSDIRRIREKNLEDWIFNFKTNTPVKYGILEVHGSDERSSQSKLVQCNKWVDEYFDNSSILCKGIYVTNQYRLKEYPLSRVDRLQFEPNEIKYAQRRQICVIPTCILYDTVVSIFKKRKLTRINIEQKILNCNGILTKL